MFQVLFMCKAAELNHVEEERCGTVSLCGYARHTSRYKVEYLPLKKNILNRKAIFIYIHTYIHLFIDLK